MFRFGSPSSPNAVIYSPNPFGGAWPLVNDWNRGWLVHQAISQIYAYTGGGADGLTGLGGLDASNVYGPGLLVGWFPLAWCSEFAAWVYMHSGGTDSDLPSTGTVSNFQYNVFTGAGAWIERNTFDPRYPSKSVEPGDYLAMFSTSSGHFGHSGIVVAVADDLSRLWTVEGNVHLVDGDHGYVRFNERPYIQNGQLDAKIDAIGKANFILPSQNAFPTSIVGTPSGYARPDNLDVVVALGSDRRLYEYTHGSVADLTGAAGGPLSAGDPFGYKRSDNHAIVVHRGLDGAIYELSLFDRWAANSLSGYVTNKGYAVPPAAGDPIAFSYGPNGGDSVLFRATNGHIYAFHYIFGDWIGQDLNAAAGAPAAADAVGEPSAYQRTDGLRSIVYRAGNGHIYAFHQSGFLGWAWTDLTVSGAAPLAASDPTAMNRPDAISGQRNSVVYRGTNNHIYELAVANPSWGWGWTDLSANAGNGLTYLAAGKPMAHVRNDGLPTIMYRARIDVPYGSTTVTTTYRLVEMSLSGSAWTANDATTLFQLPASLSDPRPYERHDNATSIPFYGPRGNTYEMTYNNGWSIAKL
jgi:hypothetical protein